eukprot:30866-Pelagococcus_subviridis.AAC.1
MCSPPSSPRRRPLKYTSPPTSTGGVERRSAFTTPTRSYGDQCEIERTDGGGRRPLSTREQVQQRALAAPARVHDGDERPGADHAVDRGHDRLRGRRRARARARASKRVFFSSSSRYSRRFGFFPRGRGRDGDREGDARERDGDRVSLAECHRAARAAGVDGRIRASGTRRRARRPSGGGGAGGNGPARERTNASSSASIVRVVVGDSIALASCSSRRDGIATAESRRESRGVVSPGTRRAAVRCPFLGQDTKVVHPSPGFNI